MLDHAEGKIAECFLVRPDAQDCRIESPRTVEIRYRDIKPNGSILLAVEVAYAF
jgi:hypothetical protein